MSISSKDRVDLLKRSRRIEVGPGLMSVNRGNAASREIKQLCRKILSKMKGLCRNGMSRLSCRTGIAKCIVQSAHKRGHVINRLWRAQMSNLQVGIWTPSRNYCTKLWVQLICLRSCGQATHQRRIRRNWTQHHRTSKIVGRMQIARIDWFD